MGMADVLIDVSAAVIALFKFQSADTRLFP